MSSAAHQVFLYPGDEVTVEVVELEKGSSKWFRMRFSGSDGKGIGGSSDVTVFYCSVEDREMLKAKIMEAFDDIQKK